MKSENDTWYVLVDGTHADPAQVSEDKDGVLKHKNGVPVALRDNGVPLTSGVATKENKKTVESADDSRELKAKKPTKGGYETRDSKAG